MKQRYRTGDQSLVREINLSIVFNQLWTHAPLSRSQLASLTGLNKTTISSLVHELLTQGFVREAGLWSSRGGRPAMLVELNPQAGCMIGLEIGVDFITAILTNFRAEIEWRYYESTASYQSEGTIIHRTQEIIHDATHVADRLGLPLLGVGVGVPGLVDIDSGVLLFAPNLRWHDIPLREVLAQSLAVPVLVDNDANLSALGEYYFGVAREVETFIYLAIGIGLGGGIFIEGRPFRGVVSKQEAAPSDFASYLLIIYHPLPASCEKRRKLPMKKLLIFIAIVGLLLAACGPAEETAKTPQPTMEFKTPLPEPTQAKVIPTNTPVPSPPTPTPRPTPIPAPTAAAETGATAKATQAPTLPPVTNDMVEIAAGPFTMGSDTGDPEDAPAHEVDLPAFEIDRFEVTNADFATFVETTGYMTEAEKAGNKTWRDEFTEGKENHPVVRVTWNDAVAYCEWLGKRLPTEAEWEKAARGTEGFSFPWGNEWDPTKANLKATGLRDTAAIGSFGSGASPYGVEDMVGNVWEWTADWYQAYPGNTSGDPYYGEQCRVTRGGGWFDEEPQATTFNRNCAVPNKTASDELGFRCARSK